jgi:ATP-dependent Clp protease ATP-binding subunit ClpC
MSSVEVGFRTSKDEGSPEAKYERMKKKIQDEIKKVFKPEFINRLDETIVFHHLSENEIKDIVDLMMGRVKKEIEAQDRSMEYTQKAKDLLAKEGFDPVFGARPLRRAIQRLVEDPLAEEFIRGNFKEGDKIMIDVSPEEETKLVFLKVGEEIVPAGEEKSPEKDKETKKLEQE